MKLYIIVHSNNKSAPGGWNASYMCKGVEIVQAFTSVDDIRRFLGWGNPSQEHAMRSAWRVVEIDLNSLETFQL